MQHVTVMRKIGSPDRDVVVYIQVQLQAVPHENDKIRFIGVYGKNIIVDEVIHVPGSNTVEAWLKADYRAYPERGRAAARTVDELVAMYVKEGWKVYDANS